MSGFSSSREELLSSLRQYTSLLEERKRALTQLSRTSTEMKSILDSEVAPDIDQILERREQDCQVLASVCPKNPEADRAMLKAAGALAANANDELGRLAQSAVSLHSDSQALGEKVLRCQNECEAILRERIDATARAIRESSQRRKLDAVYGPACKHGVPTYLDKQQ